jgi:hypothetical protein
VEESLSRRCSECGSDQINWRVHRTGTRQLRHSGRQIQWSCRGCAHEWSESIAPEPEDPPMISVPA